LRDNNQLGGDMNRFKNFLGYHPVRPIMNPTIVFSLLLILLSAWPVWGATYYVKIGGNDSLAGTSDGTAWATISKVMATAVSGDTVYFRSQDTWTGTPPLLTAAAGVTYDGSTYGSGTRATFQATADENQSTNPGMVVISVSNVTFQGFKVDGNNHATGQIYIGGGYPIPTGDITTITVQNCEVTNGRATDSGSQYYYGILVGAKGGHKTSNVTVVNNMVHDVGHEGIPIYPNWTGAGNSVDTVLLRGNTVYNTGLTGTRGRGIDVVDDSDNVTIEFNTVYNTPNAFGLVAYDSYYGSNLGSPDNMVFQYNLLYSNTTGIVIVPGDGSGTGEGLGSAYFYGNILYNSTIQLGNGDYRSSINKFYNNTVYDTGTNVGLYLVAPATNASGIDVRNNILWTTGDAPLQDNNGTITTHSNNLFYRASGTLVNAGRTAYTSANITTYETSAQATNPTFTGGTLPTGFSGTYGVNMAPNTNYFAISSGNALNNGATLGSPYDGCINGAGLAIPLLRPAGDYDIGAYNYVTVIGPTSIAAPENLRVLSH
jgi:hypothetical protein